MNVLAKRILRLAWVSVLFITAPHLLVAQDIRLKHFTADDGLPENTGQALLQDQQGFIWIGTQNGLARFDGFNFQVYKNRANDSFSLSNNQVEALFQDRQGYIWVATRNGLNRFDPLSQSFTHYFPKGQENSGGNWFRYSIRQDEEGRIWAITFYALYCIEDWENRNIRVFPFRDQSVRKQCDFVIDPENKVWLNVGDTVFQVVDEQLIEQARLPSVAVAMLRMGGDLLIATEKGVISYNTHSKTIEQRFAETLSEQFCINLYRDRSNRIWVMTTSGVYAFKDKQLVLHFKHNSQNDESLSNNVVLDMIEDAEGLFWIGTGQGINQYDPQQDQFLCISRHSEGPIRLQDQQVEVIHWQDENKLWIATATGLQKIILDQAVSLSSIPPDEWPIKDQIFFGPQTHKVLAGDNIDAIENAPGGGVFIGTAMGKLLHVNANHELQQLNSLPNYRQLRAFHYQENKHWLWCGSADGLYVFDIENNTSFIPEWLPDIDVVQMGVFQNEIWAGTPLGIYVINPAAKKIRTYSPGKVKGELNNNMLTHTLATDTVLWFSTFGGGLYQYLPASDSFIHFGETQGLINPNVWSVYADEDSKLWLSTDNGIAQFDPYNLRFKNYSKQDGLNFSDFSMSAHAQSTWGELWFGNPQGLTVFHPEHLFAAGHAVNTAITGVQINYTDAPKVFQKLLTAHILVLYPADKTVSIDLAALSYRDPESNRLAFKLEGYDANWVYRSAKEQKITYTSLPPGTYTFRAKSANKSGKWGAEFSLPIRVVPPFYQTLWFRLLAGLTGLFFLGSIIFIYNRRKYRKQIAALEVQQKIQGERERISKDLHDHVGAHLTRIITDLDLLSLQLDKLPIEENLDKIEGTRGFTQNTMQLLRDTIWAIHKDSYSLGEFADKCEHFLEQYLGDLINWQLQREINTEHELSPNQVLNLLRILQEATQNMLKHSQASEFLVQIKSDQQVVFEIRDNGKGMENIREKKGHYGLQNMHKRAGDIGGELTIESVPGAGMCINLILTSKPLITADNLS